MKISLFILILFFLSCRSNLFAQPYYQLLKNDRHWIYTQMIPDGEPPIYIAIAFALSVQEDTMLNGYSYKKIYQHTLQLNANGTAIQNPKQILSTILYALMREDSNARKVYMLPFKDTISMCQPSEHLLYDFSLQVGDTLNECVLVNLYDSSFMTYVSRVDSIRQENYMGLETRSFYTQGVFTNVGLLFEDTGRLMEGFGYELHGLINYGRKGPLVLFQYFCEGDSLDCELLSAVHEPPEIPQSVISLSPNPTRDIFIIQIDPQIQKETELQVSLLNAVGNVVLHLNWDTLKELEVDVRNLHEGMYFLNIYGKRMSTVKKIIIAR